MQQPFHVIAQPGLRWTTERIAGVGFVVLLHVIAIWAIANGLAQKIVRAIEPPPIVFTQQPTHQPPPPKAPPMPHVDPVQTTLAIAVPPPVFTIQQDISQPSVTGSAMASQDTSSQPPVPDTPVSGVAGTHTIPDYPSVARRLGQQGSVRLDLTISATGDVTGANVVQSSGFPELDRAAADWVIGHWKYKPATRAGVAASSQSLAMVVFNLKNAR